MDCCNCENKAKELKITGCLFLYDGTVDFETVAYVPKRQSKYGQGWE